MQRKEVEGAQMMVWLAFPVACVALAAFLAGADSFQSFRYIVKAKHPLLLVGLVAGLGLGFWVSWLIKEYADDGFSGAPYRRFLRGTKLANWHKLKSLVDMANKKEITRMKKNGQIDKALAPIYIGKVPMPIHLENRGTLLCAATGAGKSVCMESMTYDLVKRGDKAIIVDPNGTFYSKFGLPGDILFNPFDLRSVGWSVFNEIKSPQDFERMAKSIIPPQTSAEEEQWCAYTRNILSDTMRRLVENNDPDQKVLVELLIGSDREELKAFLSGTDSEGFFKDGAEKAIASVQFLMTKYVRNLKDVREGKWSIYDWVHDPSAGNLYLTWREDMRAAQLPVIATLVDTFCSTILSYEPMSGKRVWLSVDELASLGKLESFVGAATKGRKHGLRIIASIQDWAQLDECYGKDSAKTILSCFRNYIIFGASNAYNAEKASEVLGDHEVERLKETSNIGAVANSSTGSRAVGHERERLVYPSEISNLPDLTGYIKFGEDFPAARHKIDYVEYPRRHISIKNI